MINSIIMRSDFALIAFTTILLSMLFTYLISWHNRCYVKIHITPSFAFDIDGFVVDKNGTLAFDDRTDSEVVENLLEELDKRGFTFIEPENAPQGSVGAHEGLTIEVPKAGFTEIAIANLERLIASKGSLFKKALGIEALPIEFTEETIQFPWLAFDSTPDEVKAYTHFICALCDTAKAKKRVTCTAREVVNEKFAFRCFLLQLGFIGPDFKTERKILLTKLSGNNMMDITGVQREAFNLGFHELVLFIHEHKDLYIRFILYGQRELGE